MAYMDYSKIIEKPMKTHNNAMEFEMGNKQPNNSTASFGIGLKTLVFLNCESQSSNIEKVRHTYG